VYPIGVQVVPDWTTTPFYHVFGYRLAESVDAVINNIYGVDWTGVSHHIHAAVSSTDPQPTFWQATLQAPGAFSTNLTTNLTARVVSFNADLSATVSFCRSVVAIENTAATCFDGLCASNPACLFAH
jgi:hypothetical protein